MKIRPLVVTAAAVVAAALVVPTAGAALAQPPGAVTASMTAVIATSSRAAVAHAYRAQYAPAVRVPIGWTGSIVGCRAGHDSAAQAAATLSALNFARRLAGLSPAVLRASYSAKAQQAALVYAANGSLSHTIPSSWKCVTKDAQQAGARSNIALGVAGAKAIGAYLGDAGASNAVVGHRRWILYPSARVFGSGSTATANALWVLGDRAATGHYRDPKWVSWPSAGYFPTQLEPGGRWSLSSDRYGDDFSAATVTVTTAAGVALPVRLQKPVAGYGNATLVWQVAGSLRPASWHTRSLTVRVANIRRGTTTLSHRYTVRLFNPMALKPVTATTVSGPAKVGATLTAVPGRFSPVATRLRYQWYRGATPIAGATSATYVATSADAGLRLKAKVTGSRTHYRVAGSSAITGVVQP